MKLKPNISLLLVGQPKEVADVMRKKFSCSQTQSKHTSELHNIVLSDELVTSVGVKLEQTLFGYRYVLTAMQILCRVTSGLPAKRKDVIKGRRTMGLVRFKTKIGPIVDDA